MALSHDERRLLAEARTLILRESAATAGELQRLQVLLEWANETTEAGPESPAFTAALVARSLAESSVSAAQLRDRHAMAAVDHIDALVPPRE